MAKQKSTKQDVTFFSFPVDNTAPKKKKSTGAFTTTPYKVSYEPIGSLCTAANCPQKTVQNQVTYVIPQGYTKVKDMFLGYPSRWCKYTLAKNSNGSHTAPSSPDAAALCLDGACRRIYGTGTIAYNNAVIKLGEVIKTYNLGDSRSISGFNDDAATTFVDIQRVVALADV